LATDNAGGIGPSVPVAVERAEDLVAAVLEQPRCGSSAVCFVAIAANHYGLDVLVGCVVALTALGLVSRVRPRRHERA